MSPENNIGYENVEGKKEKYSDAPICCAGCVRWVKFGKNCFYYWEGKKHCTMWASDWDESAAL